MSDYIVRATAAEEQIRAFACTTGNLVEVARTAHGTSPVVTAALGRLLTAGAMMGAMMKGEKDLLTLQVRSDGPMKGMTVTADSHGNVKGYANVPDVILPANNRGKLDVAKAVGPGFLSVIKDLGMKEPYVGQTMLQTSEIAEDLTYYFASSEQIPSSVGLGVLLEKKNVVQCAGGFIVQLMPFAEETTISRLERNLQGVTSVTSILADGKTPEELLQIVLEGFDLQFVERTESRFACNCDKKRVERALISIGKKELKEMIEEGREVEVNCHFCNRNYVFSVEELKEMYRKAVRA